MDCDPAIRNDVLGRAAARRTAEMSHQVKVTRLQLCDPARKADPCDPKAYRVVWGRGRERRLAADWHEGILRGRCKCSKTRLRL